MHRSVSQQILFLVLAIPLCACGESLDADKNTVLEKDPRNQVVEFTLSTDGGNLDYCVDNISANATQMDVFRVLLHTADHFKERPFETVILCFRDDARFILSGADFAEMGADFETQNPMYTLRTFPEKLSLPDGSRAYKEHQGGVLYLMKVQMADFTHMNQKWYLDEVVAELNAEKDAQRPKEFASDEEVF